MAKEIVLPDLGMDMDEALLITWTKNPGDTISVGDIIAEVETDKTTVEVESPVAGTIIEFKYEPGAQLKIGEVIGFVGDAGEAAPASSNGGGSTAPAAEKPAPAEQPAPAPASAPAANGSPARTADGRIKASPIAKRIAEERGIDLANVSGTGPGGRIVRADVENYVPAAAPAPAAPAPEAPPAQPSGFVWNATYGKLPEGEAYDIEDVSKLRGRIAERMIAAKQLIPHFYVTIEAHVDALLTLRKQLNEGIEDKAQRISVNDMIVKAVARTARDFPNVNRHYYGDKYVVNKRVNVGIAVALDNGGLINVVAHDADRLALGILAVENRERINRAREGRVKPEDISGSSITVSNLGMYDVTNFIAIVNPPESAIVSVSSAVKKPVVTEAGEIGIATTMQLTLSADHRTVNGAEGGEFMKTLKAYLENPNRLL